MPFVADLAAQLRGHVEARFQMATFVPRHPAGSRASASASSIRPFTSATSPSLDDPPPAATVAPRSVQRGCRRPWQTKQRSKVRGAVWCQPMDPLARPFHGCSTGRSPPCMRFRWSGGAPVRAFALWVPVGRPCAGPPPHLLLLPRQGGAASRGVPTARTGRACGLSLSSAAVRARSAGVGGKFELRGDGRRLAAAGAPMRIN